MNYNFINWVINIWKPISFGRISHNLKQSEACHRIQSPLLTLLAHLFSFIISTVFSYYHGGELLSTIATTIASGISYVFGSPVPPTHAHGCTHGFPTLSRVGFALTLSRGLLGVFSKSIWFESECKTHHHGHNNFAEKYVEESIIGAVVLIFFLLTAMSQPFNISIVAYIFALVYIIYTYVQIWQGRLLKRTKNYHKIFLSHLAETFLLFCVVIEHTLTKTGLTQISYQYLALALTLNLTLKEFAELVGCFYRTYLSYRNGGDTPIITSTLLAKSLDLVYVTATVLVAHLVEHLGSIYYIHNATQAGIATLAEAYYTYSNCKTITPEGGGLKLADTTNTNCDHQHSTL